METEDGEKKDEYGEIDKKTGLPSEASLVGWLGVISFLALIVFILYELVR